MAIPVLKPAPDAAYGINLVVVAETLVTTVTELDWRAWKRGIDAAVPVTIGWLVLLSALPVGSSAAVTVIEPGFKGSVAVPGPIVQVSVIVSINVRFNGFATVTSALAFTTGGPA